MTGPAEQGAALEGVLAAIRSDLRRGDYARLETYSRQLEAGLAGLSDLPQPALARILRAAEGNAACLAAAAQGIRAARRRLGEIGSAARGEAYDARGRRLPLAGQHRHLRIESNARDFVEAHQERLNPRRL